MKNITIENPTEFKNFFNEYTIGNGKLPVRVKVDNAEWCEISKDDKKYKLQIDGCPFSIPFNRLDNLLHALRPTDWKW